jgi:ribonuclease I
MTTSIRDKAVNLLETDAKYIQVPFADLDELDEEGYFERRNSSFWFSRVVAIGVLLAIIGSVIVAVIYYVEHQPNNDDDYIIIPPTAPTCYKSPACPPLLQSYDAVTGITNMTGWQNDGKDSCCNICPVNVVPPSPNIKYDYLLLDQIWLPQFCYALQLGHDPTLSHLAHQRCVPSVLHSIPRLTIHGLWPNQYVGYSVCCAWGKQTVPVLDVTNVPKWTIYPALMKDWFDPTVNTTIPFPVPTSAPTTAAAIHLQHGPLAPPNPSVDCIECNLCYLLNHEWQKHGSCYGIIEENRDINANAFQYFADGLEIQEIVLIPTSEINAFNNTIILTSTLAKLYSPFVVNVMCDPQDTSFVNVNDSVGVFLEVQTCWLPQGIVQKSGFTRRNGGFENLNFTMIDCPQPPASSQFSSECPEYVFLRNFYIPE